MRWTQLIRLYPGYFIQPWTHLEMKAAAKPSLPLRTLMLRGLAILIGIIVLGMGFQERSRIEHLRAAGVSTVVDPIVDYSTRTSRGSKTCSAEFNFTTDSQQKISKRQPFPCELIADFENSKPVSVRYDPASPYNFIFEAESAPLLPFVFGIGFILAAFLLIRAPKE